jgi:hypothetical protein
MRRLAALAVGAAALAGCASVPPEKPMSAAAAQSLSGREISLATRQKPGFIMLTVGQVMGGAVFQALSGAPSTKQMGERLEQSNVPDPAEQIAADLSGAIAAKFGARVNAARVPLAGDDAREAAKGASDLVLDVRTMLWGFNYFLSDPSKYRVRYQARTRLIDTKSGQVLAEGRCEAPRAGDAGAAPTYGELMDSGAARLKNELAQAADFCAAQFASKMFSFDLAQYRGARAPMAQKAEPQVQAALKPAVGLPPAGTVWRYRFHDRKFSKGERDFSVQLAVTAGSSVTETFSGSGEEHTYSSNSQELRFAVRRAGTEPIYELAPYLLAHMPAPSAASGERPPYPAEGAPSRWNVRVMEVERGPVQVPAGQFEAVRLRITGENPALLHGVTTAHPLVQAASDYRTQRFEYTVWYVPEIGRYVQSRHQTFSRLGNLIGDQWVQLESVAHPEPRR